MCSSLRTPFVLFYRLVVWACYCVFKTHNPSISNVDVQFECLVDRRGGWWENYYQQRVSTRENFYIFLTLRFTKGGQQELEKFVHRLTQAMSNDGQVPHEFKASWYSGQTAQYTSRRRGVPVIDANMQFIIMVYWLYEHRPEKVGQYFLHCQRAWQWLDVNIVSETLHEEIDASWETSRHHNGVLLLSNVLMIHTVRCMELLSMFAKDNRKQQQFKLMYDRCVSTWMPEIYKTQEVLPRILAVHFGIAPRSFIQSFNQCIQTPWIPCRLDGPIAQQSTTHSWVYGYHDQHDTVVWPWVGMLWILILHARGFQDLAKSWWISYIEFHRPDTLYDVYSPETKLPLRRAFLRAQPCHALSIATQIIVRKRLGKETV